MNDSTYAFSHGLPGSIKSGPTPDQVKGPYNEVPGYWCNDPKATAGAMKDIQKPWIAFKVMTAGAIARRLGTTKWTIHSAIKLGKMMDERGLTSAYAELTGPPARASRWGHRDGTNREGISPAPIATSQDAA